MLQVSLSNPTQHRMEELHMKNGNNGNGCDILGTPENCQFILPVQNKANYYITMNFFD